MVFFWNFPLRSIISFSTVLWGQNPPESPSAFPCVTFLYFTPWKGVITSPVKNIPTFPLLVLIGSFFFSEKMHLNF